MANHDEWSALTEDYQQSCQRFEKLKSAASQDNASARMAYDECYIALLNCKQSLEHRLQAPKGDDDPQQHHYFHETKQALTHFKTLLQDAEIKIKNARPMPPFLY